MNHSKTFVRPTLGKAQRHLTRSSWLATIALFFMVISWITAPLLVHVQADSLFPYEANPLDVSKIASITTNSTDENYPIEHLTDGNATTGWHSNFYVPAPPYLIEIQFTESVTLDRIGYVPFYDTYHYDAWMGYQLYVAYSLDGLFFPYESGELASDDSNKLIRFDAITVRKLQMVITSTYSGFASAGELLFFETDFLQSNVLSLFQSTDFSSLQPQVTPSRIAQLRAALTGHPLADYLDTLLDRASALLTNPQAYTSRLFTPHQRGNPEDEATLKQFQSAIPYYQLTGLYGNPGETITLHVGGSSSVVMPSLCFSGASPTCATLQEGTNTLIVPDDGLGPIYISNPYDAISQPIVPTLSIEGGTVFPTFHKGDNSTVFRDQLTQYMSHTLYRPTTSLDSVPNGQYLDVTELAGDYFTLSIPASIAHQIFTTELISLTNFITQMDEWILHYQRFVGLAPTGDPRHKLLSSPVFFRYGGLPYGVLNGTITLGSDDESVRQLLRFDNTALDWNLLVSVGELFQMEGWSDVYANDLNLPQLMALYVQDTFLAKTRLHDQNAYESLYTHLFVHDAIRNYTKVNQLAAQWQLYIAYGIAPFQYVATKLREQGGLSSSDPLQMQSEIALWFSQGAQCDLTTYYDSIGYELASSIWREMDALEPCGININLIDERFQDYTGTGLPVNHLSAISKIEKNSLFYRIHITIDAATVPDILGFYIYRDGEAIAFTTSYVYDDYTASANQNHVYQIRPIDLKGQSLELSKTPLLRVEESQVDFAMTSICGSQLCGSTNYSAIFDRDVSSAWETVPYSGQKNLVFQFDYAKAIYGFTYTPSLDDFVGKIDRYVIYVSDDGVNWGNPIYNGELIYTRGVNSPVGVYFMTGYEGRYLRIQIETDHASQSIGISELQIITVNTSGAFAFILFLFLLIGIIPYLYLRYAHIHPTSFIFRWLSGSPEGTTPTLVKPSKGGKRE